MSRILERWLLHGIGGGAALLVAAAATGAEPPAAFDAKCAQLPTSRFTVLAVPITYPIDESLPIDELTTMGGYTVGRHMTFGLTKVSFGHRTQVGIRSIEDGAKARACATVEVEVTLSMQPVTVYLARELDASSCARAVTLEHELKHVAVYDAVLHEAARALADDLPPAIGPGLQRAASRAELERELNARVNDYLDAFMRRRQRELDARQAMVDSPEEHARVKAACGG